MKKYFYSFSLLLKTAIFAIVISSCEKEGSFDTIDWKISNGVLTIRGTGEIKDFYGLFEIPWHSKRDKIKRVIIEEGITSIGMRVIFSCDNLTSISLPQSLTTIGSYSIGECSSLVTIEVAYNNPNFSSVDGILYNKDKTTLIRFPEGKQSVSVWPSSITTIGVGAFGGCRKIVSISLPESLIYIESFAFRDCINLVSIILPESLTTIGSAAFSNCSNLVSITLPHSFETFIFMRTAFQLCEKLVSIDVVNSNPNFSSVDGILYDKDKTMLLLFPRGKQSISIVPNSVTAIGDYAFAGCKYLKEITIPNSVKYIGYASFEQSGLTSVTIHASIERIYSWAFTKCPKLKTIIFEGPIGSMGNNIFTDWDYIPRAYELEVKCSPFTVPNSFLSDFDLDKSILTVPKGTKGIFVSDNIWGKFKNIIEK